jgi:hypothetical protein
MTEQNENKKEMSSKEKELDLLIANIIPTSRYFEVRFDHLQEQVHELKEGQKEIKFDLNQRFEQVDKRFESVDKRFEQINVKLDAIIDRLDVKIDAGLRENRSISIRLFTFAMVFSAISMAGLLAKITNLF